MTIKRLHFTQFLQMSEGHDEERFRLKNREVFEGYVFVSDEEYRILSSSPAPPKQYKNKFKVPKRVKVRAFPPCISELGQKLSRGINLTHEGRFLMVSFLTGIGSTTEEIADLFARSPDYNAEYTDYQVNHISERDYICPNCNWVKHAHLCKNCGEYKHPLQYYINNYYRPHP